MIQREPQSLRFADRPVGNFDTASNCSGCLHCFPAGNVDFWPPQARVAACCANETVQVGGFDYVKVHHSQAAQPGCRETYKDVQTDTTGTYYEDFAPD